MFQVKSELSDRVTCHVGKRAGEVSEYLWRLRGLWGGKGSVCIDRPFW